MSRKIRFKLIIKAHRKLKVKEKMSKIRISKVNLHTTTNAKLSALSTMMQLEINYISLWIESMLSRYLVLEGGKSLVKSRALTPLWWILLYYFIHYFEYERD
jgi:DNA-binding Xre family transcriptional regulator